MTVGELILILEKHDPEMPLVILKADYDAGRWIDLEEIEEAFGKRREKHPEEWNTWGKQHDGDVKIILLS